jgi:hypothetical protein
VIDALHFSSFLKRKKRKEKEQKLQARPILQ